MAEKNCKPKCRKKDKSHNHRCNSGNDRTPAQKKGGKKRRKRQNCSTKN